MAHIDHLLNSGLIGEETLFWREGLEQWQPVTQLVARRQPERRRWVKPAIIAGVLVLLLGVAARVFGPTVAMAWREASQHAFTAEAAYWRARDVVRTRAVPAGALVGFRGFSSAQVELLAPEQAARVRLRGTLTDAGAEPRPAEWDVQLRYHERRREWEGTSAQEAVAGS